MRPTGAGIGTDRPVRLPTVETVDLSLKRSLVVIHAEGPRYVYTFDGRPYLRHVPATIVMPRSEYERQFVEDIQYDDF